jgi:hypothetical protein
VVAGDDKNPDPYGMGRVKVLCPSLHHPDIDIKDLPWCFMASQPDNLGAFSYNRPPPLGAIVEIFYSPGTKSTGQGMIRSVINGVHNPYGLMAKQPGKALAKEGYYARARMEAPFQHSGPATITMNDSDPLSSQISYMPYPIMAYRDGMDSALSAKGHVKLFYKLKSVSSARQWCACVFDADGSKSETPGAKYTAHDLGIEEWIDYVTSRMCDTFLKTAARTHVKMNHNKTSEKTLNFAYSGKKTYDIAWRLQTLNLFTPVTNQVDLNNALHTAQSYAHYQKCIEACVAPTPSACGEPMWEGMIQQDTSECPDKKPKPTGDSVKTQVLKDDIQRSIKQDGALSVSGEEDKGKELTEKLKKIVYAGGTGWLTGANIGTVMLRINKSSQGSGPIIKRRRKYPQRLINNTYKNYAGGALIDRGTCEKDDENED